jgi:RNA polymerase sigma-70 factor (ECF subfamily)
VGRSAQRISDDDFEGLLSAAREGDEASFAALWRAFNPALVRFLTGLAGPEDASDVASTVWVEVVRGLDRFSGSEAGFRAWLFTIARSRLIDLRRARARHPERSLDDDDLDRRMGSAPDPASVVDKGWSTDAAIALIGSLPPDQAEVLLLRIVADLDVATVAKMTGKRPGTVRVLAHRGLRRLAERLSIDETVALDVTR